MIFQATHQQVLDGTKTQTRRPAKEGERAFCPLDDKDFIIAVLNSKGGNKWILDQDYAVQPGRGKKAIGRIRITKIRRERLREISFSDIKAEGVSGNALQRFAFEQLWNSLYRKPYRWEDNPEVWVLEFELVGQ